MVVKLENAVIESMEETETKNLRLLEITSEGGNARLSLELPEVLCETLDQEKPIDVHISPRETKKGSRSNIYAKGTIFKLEDEEELRVVGSIGGLRLVVSIEDASSTEKRSFESGEFYIAIS
ncbi:MAG: hypothetical protein R6V83_11005 [Candidatus Thorarchaeota archaeon]